MLGIDVGSTTSKAVLIDDDGSILYSFYHSNEGNPLEVVVRIMKEIYEIFLKELTYSKAGSLDMVKL